MTTKDNPRPRDFREKIGAREYTLREETLDVFDAVTLWDENPRLIPFIATLEGGRANSEEDLENQLKLTPGYSGLARSIKEVGQMEPIYVWKNDGPKYLVLEGATRVTILRQLAYDLKGKPTETDARRVKVKILPPDFSLEERAILLAKIHVRGDGVRAWGRYIQSKFIHDTVVGDPPLMSISALANHMGKSVSWVSRLKDAYQFAQKFVDYVDADEGPKIAIKHFSTLEEISKASVVGPKLKDYSNSEHDVLRGEVFDMVRNDVFKEYRDARFLKQYYDDPEKWSILKTGEEGVANKLANDLRVGNSSLKAKIDALPGQIERALERDPEAVREEDIDTLRKAIRTAESFTNPDVNAFRLSLAALSIALENAGLPDIKSVQRDDIKRLDEALEDFRGRLEKHNTWGN